jgi:hypothetical protein
MNTDPNLYLSIMRIAIQDTDGSPEAIFAKFEQLLITTDGERRVWECFEPRVREAQIKRYYEQVQWRHWFAKLDQPGATASEDQKARAEPAPIARPITRPSAPSTPAAAPPVAPPRTAWPVAPTRRPTVPATRSSGSAQAAIMRIGLEAIYDTKTDHRGTLLGTLTRAGLEKYYAVETSVAVREYVGLLIEQMPMTSRLGDIVRKYVPKDLGNRLWDEALTRARTREAG